MLKLSLGYYLFKRLSLKEIQQSNYDVLIILKVVIFAVLKYTYIDIINTDLLCLLFYYQ